MVVEKRPTSARTRSGSRSSGAPGRSSAPFKVPASSGVAAAKAASESLSSDHLIGELSTRSSEFRTRWAAHDVRLHRTGSKTIHHPVVGELTLSYEAMELSADAGLTMHAYTTEPGSPSADALARLASWAATQEPARLETEDARHRP